MGKVPQATAAEATDADLLAEYRARGSERAFAEIVDRHADMVYRACMRMLGEAAAAEDAVQATFLLLIRKRRRLRAGTVLAGWLFLSAKAVCRHAARSAARRARREKERAMIETGGSPGDRGWAEVEPHLDEALAELPAKQREAIVLRYLRRLPEAAAAAELGCGQSTLAMRISRGLDRLRALLTRRGVTVPAATLAGMLAAEAGRGGVAVPAGLMAVLHGLGAGLPGAVPGPASPGAVNLAEGTMRAMTLLKAKLAAAVIGTVLAVGGGGLLAATLLAGEPHPPPMGPIPAATGGLVLDEGSPWRMFASFNRPAVRRGGELKECVLPLFADRTAPPPAEWMQPAFRDDGWSRWSPGRGRSREQCYGFWESPSLSLLCLRGRFFVEDPARVAKVTLALAYRGGAVVYVNGTEVARGNLPKEGRLEPTALAEDLPEEAFVHRDGVYRGSRCLFAEYGHGPKGAAAYKDNLEKRIRSMEGLAIDPKLLVKGVNVLAVELHRAPYFGPGLEMENMNHRSVFSTVGLVSLGLRVEGAAAPNIDRPAGIQVWAASDMRRPTPRDYADPMENRKPVSVVGCPNGTFNGRVNVSSDKPLAGVKAKMGELKSREGKSVIPASAVKLLYTARDDRMTMGRRGPAGGFWYPLAEEPAAKLEAVQGGALQSIVLKVTVPADAAPGDYAGSLAVSADGLAPVEMPVNLKVLGWKMLDPKEFATHMGIIQSPDSVALQYKVAPWSEEHWKLMEKSIALMGELGNNTVHIPLVTRTHWGNEQSMVRWIRKGDGYEYDFTIFDRYLDLNQKYLNLDVVILDVFDPWKYWSAGATGGPRITAGRPATATKTMNRVSVLDPANGKVTEVEGPAFSTPEALAAWKPLLAEVKSRLEKRGLGGAMMLGMFNEKIGAKADVEMFTTCLPGVPWALHAHPNTRGNSPHGIAPIGYNTYYYVSPSPPPDSGRRHYGWLSKTKTDYWNRGQYAMSALQLWRASVESVFGIPCSTPNDGIGCSGMGYFGADFWPVLGGDVVINGIKFSSTVCARYPETCWDQLNLDRGLEAMFAPGAAGALPTEVSEQIRQGLQECEARILIEKAIVAKKLDPALAKKCQDVLDERSWHIRGLGCTNAGSYPSWITQVWFEGAGSDGMAEKLYAAAAEVAAKSGGK